MRANTIVHLQELLEEPEEKKQRPALRMIGLSAGQRRVFRGILTQHQRRMQALCDANPEAAQRQIEIEHKAVELEVQRLRTQAKGAAPDGETEEGKQEEDLQEALDLVEELAKRMDMYGFGAFRLEVAQAAHDLQLRQLACVTRCLSGDWSLVDPDLKPDPAWPSLSPDDPEDALEKRVAVLSMVDEEDIRRAIEAMDAFLKEGGAGMTEEQKGN